MRHEKMAAWLPEEDKAILRLVEAHGPQWSQIAHELEGRSVAAVRNRYLRMQKGARRRAEGSAKNRCHACGQMKLGHVCLVRTANGPQVQIARPQPTLPAPPKLPMPPPGDPEAALFYAMETLDDDVDDSPSESSASSSASAPSPLTELAGEDAAGALKLGGPPGFAVDAAGALKLEVPALVRRPSPEEVAASVLLFAREGRVGGSPRPPAAVEL